MSRVKRGVQKTKSRKKNMVQTKSYSFARSKKKSTTREAIFHAGAYAFKHRRAKKREFRNLWALRINAAARTLGFSYSKLTGSLKKHSIGLDRKTLSALAKDHPEVFERVVKKIS